MKTEARHSGENDFLRLAGDTDEIIGRTPSWIIRWGTALVIIVFGSILFASWVFRYPDRLVSGIVVTSTNPPAPVLARVYGKIAHIGVREKQWVNTGDLLAVLQNPLQTDDAPGSTVLPSGFVAFSPVEYMPCIFLSHPAGA